MKRLFFAILLLAASIAAFAAPFMAGANGNWTAPGSWRGVDTASESDSEASSTYVTTSVQDSVAFTPANAAIDGIAIKVALVTNAPSGTVDIILRNFTAGTDAAKVTVNASDFPGTDYANASGVYTDYPHCWFFVTFASVTPNGTDQYKVRLSSSVNNQVRIYTTATVADWSRELRLAAASGTAPTANAKIIVSGEHTAAGSRTARTITYDSTGSTTYGNLTNTGGIKQSIFVSDGGTIADSTAAGQNLLLKVAGCFYVSDGGEYDQGTLGAPIDATSTATLQFDGTATGDSGLVVTGSGKWKQYGPALRYPYRWLASGITAGATTFTLQLKNGEASGSHGWQIGDTVVIAASDTGNNYFQTDIRTISGVSGNTITISSGTTYAHPSSTATNSVMCAVGNLTRAVNVIGKSGSVPGYVLCTGRAQVDLSNVGFKDVGNGGLSKEANVGIYTRDPGYVNADSCGFWGSTGYVLYADAQPVGTLLFNIKNSVMYVTQSGASGFYVNENSAGGPGLSAGCEVSANMITSLGGGGSAVAGIRLVNNTANGWNFKSNDNDISGLLGDGYLLFGYFTTLELQRDICHSVKMNGYELNCFGPSMTFSALTAQRCWAAGYLVYAGTYVCPNCIARGNNGAGLAGGGSQAPVIFNYACFEGEPGYPQPYGVSPGFVTTVVSSANTQLGFPGKLLEVEFWNSQIGVGTAHSTADIGNFTGNAYNANCDVHVRLRNTTLGGGTVTLPANSVNSWVTSETHNGVAGDNRFWTVTGSALKDAAIARSGSASMRITPTSTTVRYSPPEAGCRIVPVAAGVARTVSVWVRKSAVGDGAAYDGAQPRLMVKANAALGIASDTVLATASASTGTWEQLSASTPTTTGDAALFVYVDGMKGTGGWINVDDWSFSALDSRAVNYWTAGFPAVQADNTAGGGSFVWSQ